MADIRVPALGESVTEATIGKWFKQPGDPVAVDEPLVELETDKVTLEVPAPAAGVLADIAAKDGETVAVGALLGNIREGGSGPSKSEAAPLGRPDQKTGTTTPDQCRRGRTETASAAEAGGRTGRRDRAAGALGAQARGRDRDRCLDDSRLRQGRPRHQGRHAGRDRARRRRAHAGCRAGRRRSSCAHPRRPMMPRARSA